MAWELALNAVKMETSEGKSLASRRMLSIADVLNELTNEVNNLTKMNMLLTSLEHCAPQIAGSLEKSAQAGKIWREGLVQANACLRKDLKKANQRYNKIGNTAGHLRDTLKRIGSITCVHKAHGDDECKKSSPECVVCLARQAAKRRQW